MDIGDRVLIPSSNLRDALSGLGKENSSRHLQMASERLVVSRSWPHRLGLAWRKDSGQAYLIPLAAFCCYTAALSLWYRHHTTVKRAWRTFQAAHPDEADYVALQANVPF